MASPRTSSDMKDVNDASETMIDFNSHFALVYFLRDICGIVHGLFLSNSGDGHTLSVRSTIDRQYQPAYEVTYPQSMQHSGGELYRAIAILSWEHSLEQWYVTA